MRLPRMTARRWTIAVAAVAGLMSIARVGQRCWFCWKMAEAHAAMRLATPAEAHSRLEAMYRRAAWRPWESIPGIELKPD
jgi:hypothetical protein